MYPDQNYNISIGYTIVEETSHRDALGGEFNDIGGRVSTATGRHPLVPVGIDTLVWLALMGATCTTWLLAGSHRASTPARGVISVVLVIAFLKIHLVIHYFMGVGPRPEGVTLGFNTRSQLWCCYSVFGFILLFFVGWLRLISIISDKPIGNIMGWTMAKPSAWRIEKREQLALAVLKQFRVIFGSVRQHFRQIEETCGMSGSQLWVIREVHDTPGIGVSALASRLSIHQSTSSQLVEALVTRGFLKKVRLGEDQRRVGLTLTKAASKVLAGAPGPAEGILPTALAELSNQSLLALSAHLDKLITELRVKDKGHADRPLADL